MDGFFYFGCDGDNRLMIQPLSPIAWIRRLYSLDFH
jgi:hypothetical protein